MTTRENGFWQVNIRPVDKGLVVYVTDGRVESVEGRVAWNRLDSTHKLTSFKRSLRRVLNRAQTQCDTRNAPR